MLLELRLKQPNIDNILELFDFDACNTNNMNKNLINNSKMAEFYLIFTFFAWPTIRFRHQSFDIHFVDESQSGTLCRNLMWNKNVTCLYRDQACLESRLSQFSDPHRLHSGFRTVLQVT